MFRHVALHIKTLFKVYTSMSEPDLSTKLHAIEQIVVFGS
jgi:hypothetical protein